MFHCCSNFWSLGFPLLCLRGGGGAWPALLIELILDIATVELILDIATVELILDIATLLPLVFPSFSLSAESVLSFSIISCAAAIVCGMGKPLLRRECPC